MRRPVFLAALLTLTHALAAQAQTSQAQTQADPRLDAVFARWSGGGVPGCAVAADAPGAAPIRRAYGLAELEHATPATPDTIYEAGSVSKQFTAAAILLLARDGRLSLDDDVRLHIPELPDLGRTVTLRRMLDHTAGLRDWGAVVAIEGWPRGTRAMDNARVVEVMARQTALNFEPGAHWSYSNTGYNLAAVVVERVSGLTLAEFTRQRLFEPLGMAHTRWRDDHTAVVPGRAQAYERAGEGYRLAMPAESAYGNGGLLTTVGDLLIWNRALDEDRLGAGFAAALQAPGDAGGQPVGYGLGLRSETLGGRTVISHGGTTGGYRAWLGRYPQSGVSVAVLCNTGEANAAALALATVEPWLPPEPALQPAAPPESPPQGLFIDTRTGEPFGLVWREGGLATVQGRGLTYRGAGVDGRGVYGLGEDEIRFVTPDAFQRHTPLGEVIDYVRAAPARPDATALAAYAGTYGADEAPARIAVEARDGRLWLRRGAEAPIPLRPAQADVFTGPAGVVTFRRDATGAVAAFDLNAGRVWAMAFRRSD